MTTARRDLSERPVNEGRLGAMAERAHETSGLTRAAVYCRVSSAGQEDNSSLATQEAACRAYAAERGWSIVGVYREVHTGTELWERPQLTAVRAAVRSRAVDAVVCHSIDRLARDPVHLGVVLSEADHAGVEVHFISELLDDSPEGQLIRFVRGYAAKVEHEKIKERSRRGAAARLAAGKPNVGPRAPYGYQWADAGKTRLIENPDTALVVRRIFDDLLVGSSARQVAIALSRDGIPTATGRAVWQAATITQLVQNPVYVGKMVSRRYVRERAKNQHVTRHGQVVEGKGWTYGRRPAAEHVVLPDVSAALVSQEDADAVVARLAINKAESVRNCRNPEQALLRAGIAVCAYCGCHLQAITSRANGTHYRCNQTNRDAHGCPGFSIAAHKLDAAVWAGVKARLLNRDVVARELDRLRREDPTQVDLVALDRRFSEVARKQRNLMRDLAAEDNGDVAALIRVDLASLSNEHRRLEQERDSLERQRETWQLTQSNLANLDTWLERVRLNLDGFDSGYAEKRLALSACRVRVQVWATDHSPRWQATMHLGDGPETVFCENNRPGLYQVFSQA